MSIDFEKTHESPFVMLLPLIILAVGSIFAGYYFKEMLIGDESKEFWQNSIFFLKEIYHDEIPIWLLLITPMLVVLAIPISYYFFIKNTKILETLKTSYKKVYNFLLNKWYIDEIYDYIFVNPLKKLGLIFWKKGDQGTIDRFGPDGISKLIKSISNKTVQFQTGYLYDYAFVMLIGLSVLITYLILK